MKAQAIFLCLALLAVAGNLAGGAEPAPAAAPAPGLESTKSQSPTSVYNLKSGELEVTVDQAFPRVLSYKHLKTGGTLFGQDKRLTLVRLNGADHTPVVSSSREKRGNDESASYRLSFPSAGNVEITASLTVSGPALVFQIDNIRDNDAFRVGTMEIPEHSLVSVRSTQPAATLASARIEANKAKCADTYTSVTATTPAGKDPSCAAYAILSTRQLAAALETNSTYDFPKKPRTRGDGRILYQVFPGKNRVSLGLWSGEWTYRGKGSSRTEGLPWAKVVVTADRNGDRVVDWQDGAIAFREIMRNPRGVERTPDRVAQHIPFNFASIAGNPFLRVLDNVKRIHYATDGLGQMVLLKGYQSEGHDSAHPDFGGNIGRRMGGKKDMNALIETGKHWGADFGVHLNCTESYPEAKSFSETLVDRKAGGWNWLDQSYYIKHRQDLCSGTLQTRVKEMMRDVPGLAFIYMDVYYGDGWESQEMSRIIHEAGLDLATEFPDQLEHSAIWSHWSVDMTYGPDTSRGINSHIIRFIRNHQKDMFLKHPLLGHAELGDFEGWQCRTDFNDFLRKVFEASLPAKYLQHFQIMKWTDHEIRLTDGVRATDIAGRRQIYRGGRLILDGAAYLIPWDPASEKKLYHWNGKGGGSTWTIPKSWKTNTVRLYHLTDTGRIFVKELAVRDGRIAIEAEANTPYVVYPSEPAPLRDPKWGEGGPVKDPGFNDRNLSAWVVEGPREAVGIATDKHVRHALKIAAGSQKVSVSQKVTGLSAGAYAASVWVEVEKGRRKATLTAQAEGGAPEIVWTDSSFALNYAGNSEWNDTRLQRMRVILDVPAGAALILSLAAEPGDSAVRFDNVRLVPIVPPRREGCVLFEDFEHVDEGWFPFVKGDSGGVTDPRTHLSERHSPYTDAGWNGKLVSDTIEGDWSLKAHEERQGIVYSTVPETLRFLPDRKYEVSFDYQAAYTGDYVFLVGGNEGEKQEILTSTTLEQARETKRFQATVEPGPRTNVWIGVKKITEEGSRREADLILDNLAVRDLGPAGGKP
jgi:endo-alpha-N-acetylgalactosaminidase